MHEPEENRGREPATVLINAWTVRDGDQAEFAASLAGLFEQLSTMDDFVEAQIHESVDGRHFVSYVRMRTVAASDDAPENPAVRTVVRRLSELATPHMNRYRLYRSFRPEKAADAASSEA